MKAIEFYILVEVIFLVFAIVLFVLLFLESPSTYY